MTNLKEQIDAALAAALAAGEKPTEWAISYRAASVLEAGVDWNADHAAQEHRYAGLPVVVDPGVIGISLRSAPTRDGNIERQHGATTLGPDSVATYLG